MVEDIEEEDEDIDIEEISSKQKVVSCINKEEAAGFQGYVQDKMIMLVEKMKQEKNIVQPVCKLIRSLNQIPLTQQSEGRKG